MPREFCFRIPVREGGDDKSWQQVKCRKEEHKQNTCLVTRSVPTELCPSGNTRQVAQDWEEQAAVGLRFWARWFCLASPLFQGCSFALSTLNCSSTHSSNTELVLGGVAGCCCRAAGPLSSRRATVKASCPSKTILK